MHNVSSSVPSPAYKKRHVQIHQLNKIMQASTTDDNETILKGNFSFHISSEAWAIVGAPAMQPTGDLLPPQQRHSKRESTTASSPHLAKSTILYCRLLLGPKRRYHCCCDDQSNRLSKGKESHARKQNCFVSNPTCTLPMKSFDSDPKSRQQHRATREAMWVAYATALTPKKRHQIEAQTIAENFDTLPRLPLLLLYSKQGFCIL